MKKKTVFKKKITVNKEGNFVWAYYFTSKKEMREFYKKEAPYDQGHDTVGGVAINREMFMAKTEKQMSLKNKTKQCGIVLTCKQYSKPEVVCHEIMHAVLFADGVSKVKFKKQYPIVIKSMKDEERILYAFTEATKQYYKWYKRLKV